MKHHATSENFKQSFAENLPVKGSIIRIEHNRENPYVVLNKQPLFNENLSLKAKGLWAQCLARPNDWEFHVNEMVKRCKEGKRAIYSVIDELIENNYAIRLQAYEKAENGKFTCGITEYVFFEFRISDEEKGEYIEKFKKSFRCCGFSHIRDRSIRSAPILSKEEETKEKGGSKSAPKVALPEPPLSFSSEAKEIAEIFWAYILKIHPNHKVPCIDKWSQDFIRGHKIDNRTWGQFKHVLKFIFEKNPHWAVRINRPADLLKHFDAIWKEMQIKQKGTIFDQNFKFASTVRKFLEEKRNEKHLFDVANQKLVFPGGASISMCSPPEEFKEILTKRYQLV